MSTKKKSPAEITSPTEAPSVTQKITLRLKGHVIELTKDEAIEIANELDKATGRSAKPEIVIRESAGRDYLTRPVNPWPTPTQPNWPGEPPKIWCHLGEIHK